MIGTNFKFGYVVSTNPANCTCRVRFPEDDNVTSFDYQVLQKNAYRNKDYYMPDIGELVLCIRIDCFGIILGSVYNKKDTTIIWGQDVKGTEFDDGTQFKYDRDDNVATAKVNGVIEIFSDDIFIKNTNYNSINDNVRHESENTDILCENYKLESTNIEVYNENTKIDAHEIDILNKNLSLTNETIRVETNTINIETDTTDIKSDTKIDLQSEVLNANCDAVNLGNNVDTQPANVAGVLRACAICPVYGVPLNSIPANFSTTVKAST
jgi:phage baseplate assembly protein gpV